MKTGANQLDFSPPKSFHEVRGGDYGKRGSDRGSVCGNVRDGMHSESTENESDGESGHPPHEERPGVPRLLGVDAEAAIQGYVQGRDDTSFSD